MSTEDVAFFLTYLDDFKMAVYTVIGGLFMLIGLFVVFIFFTLLKN